MEIFFLWNVVLSVIILYDCMMQLILKSLYRDHQCAKSMHHKQPVKCVHCTLGKIREIGSKQFPKRTCSNDTFMSPCKKQFISYQTLPNVISVRSLLSTSGFLCHIIEFFVQRQPTNLPSIVKNKTAKVVRFFFFCCTGFDIGQL